MSQRQPDKPGSPLVTTIILFLIAALIGGAVLTIDWLFKLLGMGS